MFPFADLSLCSPLAAIRYTEKHTHFLDDGVDFWWNDEGETQWYTYYYWNLAQQAQWATAKPNERFFTM